MSRRLSKPSERFVYVMPTYSRMKLSIRRVFPTKTAIESNAFPVISSSSCSDSKSAQETYCNWASGSEATVSRTILRRTSAFRSPVEGGLRGGERAEQDRRRLALFRAEIAVTAGHGQAVFFAHGGADDDLDREIEVAGHPSDDRRLLGILLPEVGLVRLDTIEQFGYDGGHPAEMPGRTAPSSGWVSSSTVTQVWKPGGYMTSAVGVQTRSTPASSSRWRSRSRSRGYLERSSLAPNWVGLTKMLATTLAHSFWRGGQARDALRANSPSSGQIRRVPPAGIGQSAVLQMRMQ